MKPQITTLPNGLRIITERIPNVETATLGLWVNVGSRNETSENNGISHFLEHMAFKGTTTRSAKQIAEEIENVGGHLNAYTSRESTAFHARVLKKDVPLALGLIADIIQNLVFDEEEMTRERDVILQEIGQSYDTPDDIIFDYLQGTAFPGQPLGRPILGPSSNVMRISPSDLKTYMAKEYSISRMVFAATGAVEHDQIVALCEKNFAHLSEPSIKPFEKATYQGGHFFEKRNLEQVHCILSFESCPYGHENHYPFFVLSSLLGGGMSSRLFQEVREKRGLVYSVYAYHSAFRDTGLFGIYAGTGESQTKELLPTIRGILEDLPSSIEEAELERSKAQILASFMMSIESVTAKCDQHAHQMLIYNRPLPAQEIIDKVNAVTREKLIELIEQIHTQPPTFAALGPGKEIRWKK